MLQNVTPRVLVLRWYITSSGNDKQKILDLEVLYWVGILSVRLGSWHSSQSLVFREGVGKMKRTWTTTTTTTK